MKRGKVFLLTGISSILFFISSFAQSNTTQKVDKKTEAKLQAALKMRLDRDGLYARGCRDRYNKTSWLGGKISDLIASWGAPTRTVSDGAGGQIVVYETVRSGTSGGYTPASMSWDNWGNITSYQPATDTRSAYSYTEYTEITIDKNGIIKFLRWGTR